jgi:hypothetical protein
MVVLFVEAEVLCLGVSSSVKIRMEGVTVSSNWPELTAQIKPARKADAIPRLARMRIRITDINPGMRYEL